MCLQVGKGLFAREAIKETGIAVAAFAGCWVSSRKYDKFSEHPDLSPYSFETLFYPRVHYALKKPAEGFLGNYINESRWDGQAYGKKNVLMSRGLQAGYKLCYFATTICKIKKDEQLLTEYGDAFEKPKKAPSTMSFVLPTATDLRIDLY